MKTICIFLIVLCANSAFTQEEDTITVEKEGTVIFFLDQFFFFDFKCGTNFSDLVDSLKLHKGVKLWAMDLTSYSEMISGMNCGVVNKKDSTYMDFYFMPAKVRYAYNLRFYKSENKSSSSGGFFYNDSLIPFNTYSLNLSWAQVKSFGESLNNTCATKFEQKMEEGFSPGTFR